MIAIELSFGSWSCLYLLLIQGIYEKFFRVVYPCLVTAECSNGHSVTFISGTYTASLSICLQFLCCLQQKTIMKISIQQQGVVY